MRLLNWQFIDIPLSDARGTLYRRGDCDERTQNADTMER